MPKVKPLTDVENIPAFIQQVNSNFEKVEEALENTLSRDGSTPNEMNANLDMNGQNIINIGGVSFVGGPIFVADAENILFDTPVGWIADNAQEGIEEAYQKASENAVRVDVAQSHSPSRKTQGRVNLGLGDLSIKNQVSVPSDIVATGTAGSNTALFGDGSWKRTFGAGQVWLDVTGSRSKGTNYQNTRSYPIMVQVRTIGVNGARTLDVGGSTGTYYPGAFFDASSGAPAASLQTIVPPGWYYRYTGVDFYTWGELL